MLTCCFLPTHSAPRQMASIPEYGSTTKLSRILTPELLKSDTIPSRIVQSTSMPACLAVDAPASAWHCLTPSFSITLRQLDVMPNHAHFSLPQLIHPNLESIAADTQCPRQTGSATLHCKSPIVDLSLPNIARGTFPCRNTSSFPTARCFSKPINRVWRMLPGMASTVPRSRTACW